MTWSNEPLERLIDTLESGSRPTGGVSTDSGGVFSIGGENILQSGGVTLEAVKRVPVAFFKRMTKGHLRADDVLINKDGAQTGKVGWYHPGRDLVASINEHVFLLRGEPDRITQGYLYYSLLSDSGQAQIRLQISGSAQPGLKTGFTKGVTVEFPTDIREQSMIVRVLSTVDRAIEQTEALIAKQQRIKTGLMQDLLTRGIDEHGNLRSEQTHKFKDSLLGRIPVEWDIKALDEIVDESITYGIVQAGPNVDGGVPYIRTGDMRGDEINVEKLLRTAPQVAKSYKRSAVWVGDIVFALRATVGKVLPVTVELDGVNLTQGTAKISPKKSIDSDFLLWAMRTSQVQNAIRLEQKGTTFMEITLGDLRTIRLALPKKKDEQWLIAEKLKRNDRLRRDCAKQRDKLVSLKRGLMQDLLTGNRRVTALLVQGEGATA